MTSQLYLIRSCSYAMKLLVKNCQFDDVDELFTPSVLHKIHNLVDFDR